ncbi:hypothetical protein Htur_5230 (plasmid) [Haloterrigena turkmenica DSM 5511]|uniref:Uncharacterized protein n=1 Tax=Haloterrigena turkmenica (strain ATCC 51198 / DSM 5511 / JCM 9101 / NCIMB 13204 / VKM B-1734 / 4k) TaxID=543526 RepID=D2S3B4_HALTV|nr:hypothetical protein [Haloterrigena turkmenica]ADB63861.1 hypothetical protein Htur_5230 [Haloterrigena turkmenica DSM 5511]
MRFRSAAGEADQSTRESPPDATESASSTSPLRTFLFVAAGTAAVAYVLSRLRSSGDGEGVDASLETVRDRTAAAVPDAVEERVAAAVPTESQPIPIGGRESEEDDAGGDAEPIDESDVNADLADEPSPTKVSSGTSEEIQDKPAEPGEMAVDEDVEELVDDVDGEEADADESETDESDADESDTDESATDESDVDEE